MTSDRESNDEKKKRPRNKYEKIRSALRSKDSDPKINDKKEMELRKMRRFLHKQKIKKDKPAKVSKPIDNEKKAKALKFLPLGAAKLDDKAIVLPTILFNIIDGVVKAMIFVAYIEEISLILN